MQIKINKSYLVICSLFVLFSNMGFFNLIFGSLSLKPWKQIIGFNFVLLFVFYYLNMMRTARLQTLFIGCSVALIATLPSLLVVRSSIVDYLYWLYKFVGFGLFFSVFIIIKNESSKNINDIYKTVFRVCSVIVIGVFIDYFTDLISYIRLDEILEDSLSKRSYFFTGSSSNLFFILSVPIVLYGDFFKKIVSNRQFLFYVIGVCVAIFLSGSRMSLILLICLLIGGQINNFKRFIPLLIALGVIGAVLLIKLSSNLYFARLLGAFDLSDPGNLNRMGYWQFFYNELLAEKDINFFFGHGLGYLKTSENIFRTTHFESSLISLYVETGIVGLILFYCSVFVTALKVSSNIKYIVWLMLMFVNSIFVPVFPGYMFMLSLGIVSGIYYVMNLKISKSENIDCNSSL